MGRRTLENKISWEVQIPESLDSEITELMGGFGYGQKSELVVQLLHDKLDSLREAQADSDATGIKGRF